MRLLYGVIPICNFLATGGCPKRAHRNAEALCQNAPILRLPRYRQVAFLRNDSSPIITPPAYKGCGKPFDGFDRLTAGKLRAGGLLQDTGDIWVVEGRFMRDAIVHELTLREPVWNLLLRLGN